ncbi:MAG: hypothetical protein GY703_17450 [Gammaproteobacteria bacterium]|nr:hypothetical protein [Gammaproteobacteria bacterium]
MLARTEQGHKESLALQEGREYSTRINVHSSLSGTGSRFNIPLSAWLRATEKAEPSQRFQGLEPNALLRHQSSSAGWSLL